MVEPKKVEPAEPAKLESEDADISHNDETDENMDTNSSDNQTIPSDKHQDENTKVESQAEPDEEMEAEEPPAAAVMTPAERMRMRNIAAADYFRKMKEEHEKKAMEKLVAISMRNEQEAREQADTSTEESKLDKTTPEEDKEASNEKSFKCDGCEFATAHKENLRRHKKNKHGSGSESQEQEKREKCDQCDYASCKKGTLDRHKLTAHGVKSGKTERCDECDFETVSSKHSGYNMLRHKRNKHGAQDKLKCGDCDYETPRKDILLKHRRNKHKQESPEPPVEVKAKAVEVPIITKKELSEDEADAVLDALSSHFMSDKVHID